MPGREVTLDVRRLTRRDRRLMTWLIAAATIAVILPAGSSYGQYSKIATPFGAANDSFFERIGVGFGFNINGARFLPGDDRGPSAVVGLSPNGAFNPGGLAFQQNGFGSAIPPFGGFDPGSVGRLGVGIRGSGGGMFFNLEAGQGSDRSFVSQTPMIVVPNGGGGFFSDSTQTPFVTGIIPVVGGFDPRSVQPSAAPVVTSPLRERLARIAQGELSGASGATVGGSRGTSGDDSALRLTEDAPLDLQLQVARQSTAGRADASVAEIRRQRAAQVSADEAKRNEEAAELARKGEEAEADGQLGVAKIFYRQAASRASGEARQELLGRLKRLEGK